MSVRTEQWVAFVVAPVVWGASVLLGAGGARSAVIATIAYLGAYFGMRAWRRKRGR